jgi:outer membrane protein assembly factor BamB
LNNVHTNEPTRQPLRLWPGVVIVLLQWLLRFVVPIIIPEALTVGVMGGLVCGLGVVVWWGFFSRAPRRERWVAVVLMIVAFVATSYLVDESIATAMMGMMLAVYAFPVLSLAFVIWAVASHRLPEGSRRATMVATILLACGVWTLVRTGGFTGDMDNDFAWRWAQTPEERLLAQAGPEPTGLRSVLESAEVVTTWPGFRGPDRDSIIRGVRIATDWSESPPRRAVAPAYRSRLVLVRGSRRPDLHPGAAG